MPVRVWSNRDAPFDAATTPIYINVRDRVSDLALLVSWLEDAGYERIILLDNNSRYEPLLDYLHESPHEVEYLGRNVGSQSLWTLGRVPDEWFVYTDPDLVPIADCPRDLVAHMHELAERYRVPKVGAGLYIVDLPEGDILDWERSLVHDDPVPTPGKNSYLLEPGVYSSLVDTTFALYRPSYPFDLAAIRLGYPYQMRHTSWYSDPDDLGEEERFYLSRAKAGVGASSWAQGTQR